jgi:hypothetical protein
VLLCSVGADDNSIGLDTSRVQSLFAQLSDVAEEI